MITIQGSPTLYAKQQPRQCSTPSSQTQRREAHPAVDR